MPGLQVVTHNGLPVDKGGKRLGYCARDERGNLLYYPLGSSQPILWPFGIIEPEKPKIIYADLPRVDIYRECSKSSCWGDTKQVQEMTDKGLQTLYKCRVCGKLHRPRFD